jgi:hypothetical protein
MATIQGANHKRFPDDVAEKSNHPRARVLRQALEVGKTGRTKFSVGQKYGVMPQLNIPGHEHWAPVYSFRMDRR